jgi:hypothetical protein
MEKEDGMERAVKWQLLTFLGMIAVVGLLTLTGFFGIPRAAYADDAQDARHLVDKARLTFEAFMADKDMGPPLHSLLKRARGC